MVEKKVEYVGMSIRPLGDGKYKLSTVHRFKPPGPERELEWACLRQEPNGCNWDHRLTKEEVLARLEKEL